MQKINVRANNLELIPSIESYIKKKTDSFSKYLAGDSVARLYVEISKTTEHHRHGDVFRAEFNLETSDGAMRSEAEGADLYSALDEAKDELLAELRKNKDKKITLFREGYRKVKDFLKRF
ncbi:MAG: ribosome-associated translation inhibitor RaiA [Patescibacteria group bacterium]